MNPPEDHPGPGPREARGRPDDGGDHADAGPTLRVVLVGRTGLDQSLRRDARVELLRCRTALDAVGELGDPMPGAPAATAVIVAEDADPSRHGIDEARAFVASLRQVAPRATVLTLARDGTGVAPAGEPYDGCVSSAVTPGELEQLVRRRAQAAATTNIGEHAVGRATVSPSEDRAASAGQSGAGPTSVPSVPAEAGEAVPPGASGASAGATAWDAPAVGATLAGDEPALHAVLAGRDVLAPAMTLLRARLARGEVVFVAEGSIDGGTPVALPPGGVVAVVEHRGQTLGRLWGRGVEAGALQSAAAWLGAWLALGRQQAQLREAAMTDEVTGAYNRRYFERYLAGAIEQAGRHRQWVTLLVFDLDNFKAFNDRYGHPAGDSILRETVRLLRSVIRPSDRVCRIGGDEFAVIFYEPAGPRDPGSRPPETVFQIAQRFQAQIREHRFPKLGDCAPGTLTVSGGLAAFPWDGRSVEELVAHADALALQSKREGKNAIRFGPDGQRC